MTLCPYLHALVPLLHVNSRTNYCSQQPYFNVLTEKLRFSLFQEHHTPSFYTWHAYFSLYFQLFQPPFFCHFLGQKRLLPCIIMLFLLKSKIVEQQMLHTRYRRVVLWHKYSTRYYRHCGTKLQLDDSSGYYTTATVMRNGGAKPQKPTAQGNALGKRVRRFTPYRGKSKSNILTANCFCPYRTQLLHCTATSGRCPELCAYWAFSPSFPCANPAY